MCALASFPGLHAQLLSLGRGGLGTRLLSAELRFKDVDSTRTPHVAALAQQALKDYPISNAMSSGAACRKPTKHDQHS